MLTAAQALVKLDIDSNKRPTIHELVKLCDRAGVAIEWLSECRSPGGKGWHIVISVSPRPRTAMEVVALQAVLGGDRWREAVSIGRARVLSRCPKFMRDRWNVLYQKDRARSRRLSLKDIGGS